MNIGNRLKILRKANGLTQQQLAEALGVSRVNYTRYETDVNKPDYDTLVAVADFYDVSVDYILGRQEI